MINPSLTTLEVSKEILKAQVNLAAMIAMGLENLSLEEKKINLQEVSSLTSMASEDKLNLIKKTIKNTKRLIF
jgi:hypothetical protein